MSGPSGDPFELGGAVAVVTGATRGLSGREQRELEQLLDRPLTLKALSERPRRSDARRGNASRGERPRRDASHERKRRKPR